MNAEMVFPPKSGTYVQERFVKDIADGFRSSGSYSYKDGVLNWQQEKPQESLFQVSNIQVLQKVNGLPDQVYTYESHPHIFSFIDILFSVIKGDEEKIRKHFQVKQENKSLILKPKNKNIGAIVRRIFVAENGRKIIIHNNNGGRTQLSIQN